MIPKIMYNEKVMNSLAFARLDGMELDKAISGKRVIGAEPIDHPETDGLYIYLEDGNKKQYALFIDTLGEDVVKLSMALLPTEAGKNISL